MRADVPHGVQCAQLIHAAGSSSPGDLPEGTVAVALAVANEEALVRLELRLQDRGVPHKAVREPDPPYNGALLAIGVFPGPRSVLRRFFRGLSLIGVSDED